MVKEADAGVDMLVTFGTEAGGHCGEVSTMVLIPEVLQAIEDCDGIEVLAAGGIGHGAPNGGLSGNGRGRRLDRIGLVNYRTGGNDTNGQGKNATRDVPKHRSITQPNRQTNPTAQICME